MKEERWDLINTIVDNALTLTGREKDAYLSTVYQENPEIREEIEALLHSIKESEAKQFMKPLRQDHKELVASLSNELEQITGSIEFIGKEIGAYHITKQLGSGGMGSVFKAERTDGEFHHEVAIKLIKKGIDFDDNIRRFRMEREILAGLHHPNIAQLHDGGVTKDGIPYLIMEYIKGVPVDQYCNEHQLTVNERLKLFKNICDAVQLAHTNLVVHRDLKAGNIYVTDQGAVKVLDFGIAKLLDDNHSDISLLETRPGQKFWTPQYAAPEQVKGETVTTATDIYALGVLLHKLLADTYPLNLEGKSISKVENIIKNGMPSSLSQSVANNPSKNKIAKHRNASLSGLLKKLRGDLDALVLKAIRKEPEYRYTSVSQLMEDIERYLSGIPLIARNGTLQYRAAKFMRRHKAGLVASAVFLITIVALAGFYTWKISKERDRAKIQAHKAEQVTQFMMGLFKSNDPKEALGDTLIAPEILDRGLSRIETLTDQPEVQGQMLEVIGGIYESLGKYGKAQSLFEQSLFLRRKTLGSNHLEIASSMNDLAQLLAKKGNYELAEPYARQALEMRRNILGENHLEIAQSLNTLASLLQNEGKYNEAEPRFREALAIRQNLLDEDDEDVITSINNLAVLLHLMGDYTEAELFYRKVVAADRKLLDKNHPYLANDLNNLAYLLMDKGDYSVAEPIFRESLEVGYKVYGKSHPAIANTISSLARLLQLEGHYNEAEQFLKEALDMDRELLGEDHQYTISDLKNLGVLLYFKGDYNTSEKILRKTLSMFQDQLGEEHPRTATCLRALATLLRDKGHYKEAEQHYQKALAIQRKLLDRYNLEIANTLMGLGQLFIDQQRAAEAKPLVQEVLTIRLHTLKDDDWRVAEAEVLLGACLTIQNHFQEAESLLVNNYEVIAKKNNIQPHYRMQALKCLISLYDDWGKPEQAEPYKKELALVQKGKL